ncbi:MAG: MgtC/SapB family protein, partial [Halobacteriaceae archaeon]
MVGTIELFGATSINNEVVRIALAVALGLFLGLEREWSQKEAGIRTFALISVLGTIFTLYDGVQCSRTA